MSKSGSKFVTLAVDNADYQNYLTGRFSKSQRALPEVSFSREVKDKPVTFRIVEASEVEAPLKIMVIFLALRPKYLILSLGPLLALGVENWSSGFLMNPWLFLSGVASFSFFYFSFFLANDYLDHVSGQDRLYTGRGSRIIQRGWEPAYRIQQWAVVNLALGFMVAALAVDIKSPLVWFTSSSVLLSFFLFAALRKWRVVGLAEMIIFSCFGPLLVIGFQVIVLRGHLTFSQLFMSGFFGAQAVIYFHLRQLENIFDGSQLGVRNLVTSVGFDRAKYLIGIEVGLSALWYLGFLYWSGASWIFYVGIVAILPRLRNLYDLSSPLSSLIKGLSLRWLGSHLLMLVVLLVALGVRS